MTELIFSDMPNFLKGFLGTFLVYLATSNLEECHDSLTENLEEKHYFIIREAHQIFIYFSHTWEILIRSRRLCLCVAMCSWGQGPVRGQGCWILELELWEVVSTSWRCWELNLGSLQDQNMIIITEPSLHLQSKHLYQPKHNKFSEAS